MPQYKFQLGGTLESILGPPWANWWPALSRLRVALPPTSLDRIEKVQQESKRENVVPEAPGRFIVVPSVAQGGPREV